MHKNIVNILNLGPDSQRLRDILLFRSHVKSKQLLVYPLKLSLFEAILTFLTGLSFKNVEEDNFHFHFH